MTNGTIHPYHFLNQDQSPVQIPGVGHPGTVRTHPKKVSQPLGCHQERDQVSQLYDLIQESLRFLHLPVKDCIGMLQQNLLSV